MMNKVEERILRNRIPIDADEIFERFRKDDLPMTKERALNIATKMYRIKLINSILMIFGVRLNDYRKI